MSAIEQPATEQPVNPKVHDLTEQSVMPGLKSVLMLEDDLAFAETVSTFLESHSFEVKCVPNGVEGLNQIVHKDFDIVLCDLLMPNLPGNMFYLAVERSKKHLCKRFIFMTGHGRDEYWAGFLSKVNCPILEKPFGLATLLSTVEALLTENALNP